MSRQLLQGTLLFSIAAIISAGINALFYTLGRLLGPEEFGKLTALIAILFLLTTVQSIFSNLITKVVAGNDFSIKDFVKKLTPIVFKLEGVIIVIFIVASVVVLSGFLRINDWQPYLWIALWVIPAFLSGFHRGILQGRSEFGSVAALQILEALLKLFASYAAVLMGFGVYGVLFAMIITTLLVELVTVMMTKRLDGTGKANIKTLFPGKLMTSLSLVFIFLNVIMAIDALVARNRLAPIDAGLYGGIVTFGKFVYFLTNAITLAMFPLASSKKSGSRLIYTSILMTLLFTMVSVLGFMLFGEQLTGLIMGPEFKSIAAKLPMQAVIMGIYSLINLIAVYLMGKDKYKVLPMLVLGFIVQTGSLMIFGTSIEAILNLQLMVMLLIFTAVFTYLISIEFLNGRQVKS